MMRHPNSMILSMVCCLLPLAGCVATSTFEAKEAEAKKVSRELQAARLAERRLGSELEAALEQRAILERDLSGTRSSLAALEGEVGQLRQGLAQKERELRGVRGDLALLQQMGAQKDEEIARLRGTVGAKEQELSRLQSTYGDLVRDLKKEIEAGEIKVTQYRDLLTVNLVEKILFDSGKAEIKPRGREILRKVGDILKTAADKQIQIEGHTDNVRIGPGLAGKYPTNWELSTARATVVARYFQEKVGVPPDRLVPAGFAEYRPVASNDLPEGRAQNRRIEIILAPARPGPTAN